MSIANAICCDTTSIIIIHHFAMCILCFSSRYKIHGGGSYKEVFGYSKQNKRVCINNESREETKVGYQYSEQDTRLVRV